MSQNWEPVAFTGQQALHVKEQYKKWQQIAAQKPYNSVKSQVKVGWSTPTPQQHSSFYQANSAYRFVQTHT